MTITSGTPSERAKRIREIIASWREPGKSPTLVHADQAASWMEEVLLMAEALTDEVADLQARLAWFEERVGDPRHIVVLTETGWYLNHPFSCRPNVEECEMNEYVGRNADDFMDRYSPGRYAIESDELTRA